MSPPEVPQTPPTPPASTSSTSSRGKKRSHPPSTRGPGRPRLYDQVKDRLLDAIRAGIPKEIAAQTVGVAPSTLYDWQNRHPEFLEAVHKAVADSEAILVAKVAKAAGEDWRAAMTLLERRFPERWARRDHLEVQGRLGVDVSLERLREIRARAEARKKENKA